MTTWNSNSGLDPNNAKFEYRRIIISNGLADIWFTINNPNGTVHIQLVSDGSTHSVSYIKNGNSHIAPSHASVSLQVARAVWLYYMSPSYEFKKYYVSSDTAWNSGVYFEIGGTTSGAA